MIHKKKWTTDCPFSIPEMGVYSPRMYSFLGAIYHAIIVLQLGVLALALALKPTA